MRFRFIFAAVLLLLLASCASESVALPSYSPLTAESTHSSSLPLERETAPETSAPLPVEPTSLLDEPITVGIFTTNIDDAEIHARMRSLSDYLEGDDAAIWYEDLESGGYFYSNPTTRYYFQSVTKAFYASRLYARLSDEELESTLVLTQSAREPGGEVYNLSAGSELTVEYLIEQAVRNSDVTAYNLLYDSFGIDDFNRYARSLGSGLSLKWGRFSGGRIADASALLRDIWARRDGDASKLIEHMKSTAYNYLIPAGIDDCEVAHKYGYGGDGLGLNDAAIVFDERPFMLIVLSNFPIEDDSFAEPFIETARTAQEIAHLMH